MQFAIGCIFEILKAQQLTDAGAATIVKMLYKEENGALIPLKGLSFKDITDLALDIL